MITVDAARFPLRGFIHFDLFNIAMISYFPLFLSISQRSHQFGDFQVIAWSQGDFPLGDAFFGRRLSLGA